MERITSRGNPLLSRVRKLSASASFRREEGVFLLDGHKLLREALLWNAALETVLFSGDTPLPPLPTNVRQVWVPEDVMGSLAPSRSPQGVLALCAIPARPLPERLDGRRYLLLDGVQDPGNVGTILRTADALGADGVLLGEGCADLYSPKTVRATMGALFRLDTWTCTAAQAGALARRSGLPVYGTALRSDTRDLRRADLRRFLAAVGSEGQGLSQEVLDLCDLTLRIPMRPRCESLNAAMAASILLWEAARTDESAE